MDKPKITDIVQTIPRRVVAHRSSEAAIRMPCLDDWQSLPACKEKRTPAKGKNGPLNKKQCDIEMIRFDRVWYHFC